MDRWTCSLNRSRPARGVVEMCEVLDINWMTREGIFDRPGKTHGHITTTFGSGTTAAFDYVLDKENHQLKLRHELVGVVEQYTIKLTQSVLPWGGLRWWLLCPLAIKGKPCQRRVAKLWRPRSARHFGCRQCHGLTYYLCQQSHKRDLGLHSLPAPPHWPLHQRYRHDMLEDFKDQKRDARIAERQLQRSRRRKQRRWA